MKILLINDNPVVNKLVTLSAQKTSDTLEVVDSLAEASDTSYDLVVIDDTLYSDELVIDLEANIKHSKSLYICSRDADVVEGFSRILKKPFLPTDLVEIFATFGKEVSEIEDTTSVDENFAMLEDDSKDLDDLEELDSLDELEELGDLDELADLEEISELEELDLDEDDETLGESILDDEEAQKVKDLLDETEDEDEEDDAFEFDIDFDDDEEIAELGSIENDSDDEELTNLDEDSLEEIPDLDDIEEDSEDTLDEELMNLDDEDSLEEMPELDNMEEDSEDTLDEELMNLDDEDSLEEMPELDNIEEDSEDTLDDSEIIESENLELEEPMELDAEVEMDAQEEELDLESQIENAVDSLSDEELESEVDEDTLLDIVTTGIDSLDALSSRDIKLAVGEEVAPEIESVDNLIVKNEDSEETLEDTSDGVEALKTLLAALSDEKVVASLKGMKISINITLGDN